MGKPGETLAKRARGIRKNAGRSSSKVNTMAPLVHETTIHSVDAEAAAGLPSPIPSSLAADGVDEMLCGLLPRNRGLHAEEERSALVSATDTGDHWLVRYGPERPSGVRVESPVEADSTVAGTAAELYLSLWNRGPWDGLTADGGLASLWTDNVRI
ncbi:hypothetical protein KUTG_04163 [Kutzneria sp. 744]|nr:hypothetical protein KUTG_04163 [Kutzneria sp. 744]